MSWATTKIAPIIRLQATPCGESRHAAIDELLSQAIG